MKTITLNIPEGQRIGEAIYDALYRKIAEEERGMVGDFMVAHRLQLIEDQSLLSLIGGPSEKCEFCESSKVWGKTSDGRLICDDCRKFPIPD